MPKRTRPNNDPRWSSRDALDENPDEGGFDLEVLWRKLKLLKYNPWLRDHLLLLECGVFLVVLLVFVWVVADGFQKPDKSRTPPAVTPTTATTPKGPSVSTPMQAPTLPQKLPADVQPSSPSKEESGSVRLPKDVKRWKPEHFVQGREEGNPHLIDAVAELDQQTISTEATVQMLIDLLKPLKGASDSEGPTVPNPTMIIRQIETIIEALGDSESELARDALTQILAGRLRTDDDRTAVGAALKTLVAHPSAATDAILLTVLTSPIELRPAERQGPWPAPEMQYRAVELVKTSNNEGLRFLLAEHLIRRGMVFEPGSPIYELLKTAQPENCRAQILLYQKANMSRDARLALEQGLVGYASKGLAGVLGVSDISDIAEPKWLVSPERKSGLDVGRRLAPQFWTDEFSAGIQQRLEELPSLAAQPSLVLLAGAIPTESVRVSLLKLFRKCRSNAPKVLESAGKLEQTALDPGLLVSMKLMPRRDSRSVKPVVRPVRPGTSPAKAEQARQRALQEQKIQQEWLDLSRQMMVSWCRRCQLASKASEFDESESSEPRDAKLPSGLELPPGVTVVAGYHRCWPEELPAELAAVKPGVLVVHYVCVQGPDKPKKAVMFYARQVQAKPMEIRTIDGATWIDTLRAMPAGTRRSVDIVINRVATDPSNLEMIKDDSDTALTTEILVVEVKDPMGKEGEGKETPAMESENSDEDAASGDSGSATE